MHEAITNSGDPLDYCSWMSGDGQIKSILEWCALPFVYKIVHFGTNPEEAEIFSMDWPLNALFMTADEIVVLVYGATQKDG